VLERVVVVVVPMMMLPTRVTESVSNTGTATVGGKGSRDVFSFLPNTNKTWQIFAFGVLL